MLKRLCGTVASAAKSRSSRYLAAFSLIVLLQGISELQYVTAQELNNNSSLQSLSANNDRLAEHEKNLAIQLNVKKNADGSLPDSAGGDFEIDLAFQKMRQSIGKPVEPENNDAQVQSQSPRGSLKYPADSSFSQVNYPDRNKIPGTAATDKIPATGSVLSPYGTETVNPGSAITSLRAENYSLMAQLTSAKERSDKLLEDLKKTRNELMMAQTEIERLSRMIEDRNISNYSKYTGQPLPPANPPQKTSEEKIIYAQARPTPAKVDLPVATVIVSKANLRTGPSKDDSPIMNVSKGTRLVVEQRVENWYRVLAPNGTRAWISGEVVAFGKDDSSSPSQTIRVKSYDPEAN